MDNTTQLFIRACKSNNPELHVRAVYKRFYVNGNDHNTVRNALINILGDICDKHIQTNIRDLMMDLQPGGRYGGPKLPYLDQCLSVLVSIIQTTKVDQFKGLTTPAK